MNPGTPGGNFTIAAPGVGYSLVPGPDPSSGGVQRPRAQNSVESLGQNQIDGVRVEGTSYTTTFPANSFGNEMPIVVEKTTWYAPELRLMLRTEERDPRIGTITYESEITSIDEPDAWLFEVPADYDQIGPGRTPHPIASGSVQGE